MPMNPATLLPIMTANLISNGIAGSSVTQLASGLSNGLSQYATGSIRVQTIDVGTVGAGVGTGFGIIIPPSISTAMSGSFLANSLTGSYSLNLSNAIAQSFIQAFSLALISTTSPSVGIGSGKVILIPNPSISTVIFYNAMVFAGMSGIHITQLASAIANGLDSVLPSANGVVVITGSPSIYSSSGSGFGILA